ncbi:hypothetical protein BKA80DRAFT_75877 [Phyllosticta citrichinensis]
MSNHLLFRWRLPAAREREETAPGKHQRRPCKEAIHGSQPSGRTYSSSLYSAVLCHTLACTARSPSAQPTGRRKRAISHKSLLASHSKTQGSPLHNHPPTTWLLCMSISPRIPFLAQPNTRSRCSSRPLASLFACQSNHMPRVPSHLYSSIIQLAYICPSHRIATRKHIHNCAMQLGQSSNAPAPRTKRAKEPEPQHLTNVAASPNPSPTCRELASSMPIVSWNGPHIACAPSCQEKARRRQSLSLVLLQP